jgi:hypothetical protein
MTVKKAVAKKKSAKKAVGKSKTKTGDMYACQVCGLAVTVDETCGCVDYCDIVCCDTPMKKKRARR